MRGIEPGWTTAVRRAALQIAGPSLIGRLPIHRGLVRSGRAARPDRGRPSRFQSAHLGAPDPARVTALRERFGTGPVILTIGRIQRRKDRTWSYGPAELVKRFPALKYLVVGSTQGGTDGLAAQLSNWRAI